MVRTFTNLPLYLLVAKQVEATLDGSLAQSVEQLAFNQLVEGSNPSRPTTFLPVVKEVEATPDGSLAQSVEQLAFNQLVEGSNPSRPTTSFK